VLGGSSKNSTHYTWMCCCAALCRAGAWHITLAGALLLLPLPRRLDGCSALVRCAEMHAMLPQQTLLTLSCLCMQGGWRPAMAVHMAALLLLAPFTFACRNHGFLQPPALLLCGAAGGRISCLLLQLQNAASLLYTAGRREGRLAHAPVRTGGGIGHCKGLVAPALAACIVHLWSTLQVSTCCPECAAVDSTALLPLRSSPASVIPGRDSWE
jgi:hypothetical protein